MVDSTENISKPFALGGASSPHRILWVAIAFLSSAILVYLFNFAAWPYITCVTESGWEHCFFWSLSSKTGTWAEFGDFIGGFVNPLLGLLTIYLLVNTIAQQNKALLHAESALEHAERALEQNAQIIEMSREELKVLHDELRRGQDIQKATEDALKQQIGLARSQNNFSNHYKHMEEFERYVKDVSERQLTRFVLNVRALYQDLYPSSKDGEFRVPNNSLQFFQDFNIFLMNCMQSFEAENWDVADGGLADAKHRLAQLFGDERALVRLALDHPSRRAVPDQYALISRQAHTPSQLLTFWQGVVKLLEEILLFDGAVPDWFYHSSTPVLLSVPGVEAAESWRIERDRKDVPNA